MKTDQKSLTLRQQYEARRQTVVSSAASSHGSIRREDELLRSLIGHAVVVRFLNGEEVNGVFAAMDRFTMILSTGAVLFKHAVQSVRSAETFEPADRHL